MNKKKRERKERMNLHPNKRNILFRKILFTPSITALLFFPQVRCIIRKNGLGELILTGSVDGKRSRGRQREKNHTNQSRWLAEQLPRREKDKSEGNKSVENCKRQKYVEIPLLPMPLISKAPRERDFQVQTSLHYAKNMASSGLVENVIITKTVYYKWHYYCARCGRW